MIGGWPRLLQNLVQNPSIAKKHPFPPDQFGFIKHQLHDLSHQYLQVLRRTRTSSSILVKFAEDMQKLLQTVIPIDYNPRDFLE